LPTQRLHSLDAFRGITIAGMILVNNPGSWSYVYAPLRHALRSGRPSQQITGALFTYGWAAIVAGIVWNVFFPINKNLWTSSYVVFTTGAALQFLGVCYWTIEVQGWKRWATPAIVFGKNAIAVFALSGLVAETMIVLEVSTADGVSLYGWIYRTVFVPVAGQMNGSLAFAIATVSFWFVMMWLLYKRNIFIKV
jgi:predicted acyltransferase